VQSEEISRVIPIFNIVPLFVLIFAFIFLGETLKLINYFGALLIIAGAILISSNKRTKIILNKTVGLVIISSILYAFNAIITKYVLGFTDFWTAFFYEYFTVILIALPFLFIWRKDILSLAKKHKKTTIFIALTEIFNIFGTLFITIGAANGPVGLVRTLQSIQPFFVFFFVLIIGKFSKVYNEDNSKSIILLKTIAIVLLFAGVILIAS
jgi:drug/metabolite transporter (DMT)-like permease